MEEGVGGSGIAAIPPPDVLGQYIHVDEVIFVNRASRNAVGDQLTVEEVGERRLAGAGRRACEHDEMVLGYVHRADAITIPPAYHR